MLIITIGQHLAPELAACERTLGQFAVIYAFEQTADALASWQVAGQQPLPRSHQPAAVIWLQSRSGEFQQSEVEAIREIAPHSKLICLTGVFSEGEKRSGKPLAGVTHTSWQHGAEKLRSLVAGEQPSTSPIHEKWLAIHAANLTDYQGLAALCQTMGYQTLWQPAHCPQLSSEPALRLFVDWTAWQQWQSTKKLALAPPATAEILLLAHPRPADLVRARQLDISQVLSLPFTAADLRSALTHLLARQPPASIRLAA